MASNKFNEKLSLRNYNYKNIEFSDKTTKNLMSEFNNIDNNNNDLNDFTNIDILSISNISALQLDQISNQIFNKFNYYKQLLNFKEEVNYEFHLNCQNFLKNIEKMILEIFKYNDTTLIKNSIIRIESLINQNHEKFEDLKGTLAIANKDKEEYFTQSNEKRLKVNDYVNFLKTLSSLFSFLEKNFKLDIDEEKKNLEKVNTFLQILCDFSFKLYGNLENLDNLKIHKLFPNINQFNTQLLNDHIESSHSQVMSPKIHYPMETKNKIKRIYQQNFFQFYFVKEDGFYFKNYSSKGESLKCSRKYKYYEIKFKLSKEENSYNINSYIKSILELFSKYIIAFKEDSKNNQFTKVIITGISICQNLIRKKLTRILQHVKKDCLIKISIFSSISRCFKNTYKKCYDEKTYSYFVNF